MQIITLDKGRAMDYYSNLLEFIIKVDAFFEPPLSKRVNLESYAKKLCQEANLIVCIEHSKIQGACAYYCTPDKYEYAFLSFISTLQKGLGSRLVEKMILSCKEYGVKGIETQTWETNSRSLNMFLRYNFQEVEKVDNRGSEAKSVLLKLKFYD
jgi:ribosomal protein S18 acetylase RimI-like enzyme